MMSDCYYMMLCCHSDKIHEYYVEMCWHYVVLYCYGVTLMVYRVQL